MIAPDLIREILDYDLETGNLRWRTRPAHHFVSKEQSADLIAARWNSRFAGRLAFQSVGSDGYLYGRINGQRYSAHRVIWALAHGKWPNGEIDHENGNRADNGIDNLRDVSHRENAVNAKRISRNTSGQTGVQWVPGRDHWIARIHSRGRTRYLGSFTSFDRAVAARKSAERAQGFHPNHGRAAV